VNISIIPSREPQNQSCTLQKVCVVACALICTGGLAVIFYAVLPWALGLQSL
jgi:hypothetical protein